MGTRHLTCVVADGDYKIAQYGQWDGYPEGQGVTVLDFLHDNDLDKFKNIVINHVNPLSVDEVAARWKECGADDSGWVGMDIASKFKEQYPTLSRDVGAKVLNVIMDNAGGDVFLDVNFAADSLFCEYTYMVDLDKSAFEVYEGFNRVPLEESERFYFLTENARDGYQPVKHLVSWNLNELPSKDDFIKTTNRLLGKDEEDDE